LSRKKPNSQEQVVRNDYRRKIPLDLRAQKLLRESIHLVSGDTLHSATANAYNRTHRDGIREGVQVHISHKDLSVAIEESRTKRRKYGQEWDQRVTPKEAEAIIRHSQSLLLAEEKEKLASLGPTFTATDYARTLAIPERTARDQIRRMLNLGMIEDAGCEMRQGSGMSTRPMRIFRIAEAQHSE
jgi:Fic family protein